MNLLIDDPLQFVAFTLAALISFCFILSSFYGVFKREGSIKPLVWPVLIGFVLTVFAGLSAYHNKTDESLAWLYSSEAVDRGVFEWGTVLCLVSLSVLSVLIARKTTGLQRYLFAALALAGFVICGEEMSWGQWIFHWQTPAELAQINLQDETNLHNLVNPRLYDLLYYFIGYSVLIGALLAYFVFGKSAEGTLSYGKGLKGIFVSAGHWLRRSPTVLVITVAAATLMQHELMEEYAEFVLALAIALFLYFHAKQLPKRGHVKTPKRIKRDRLTARINRLAH